METYFKKNLLKKRLEFLLSEKVLTLLLLFLALISIFLLQNHKTGFEDGHHGFLSSHGITLAKSIFSGSRLLMFTEKSILEDGTISYDAYNRFPIFPFLIIGTALRAFEPNLAEQIYIARQIMNLFFVASIILSFLISYELLKNYFLSVSATLLVFSSYYMLYYNDMIFNDTPALFGFVLALFLTIKSHVQKHRLRTIVLLSIVSISMGWQPYAVFISWFLSETFHLFATKKKPISRFRRMTSQPSFIGLVSAILWGLTILGLQLFNEWSFVGGSFQEIPTIQKAFWRLGIMSEQSYAQHESVLEWSNFLADQLWRTVRMIIPFAEIFQVNLGSTRRLILLACVGGLILIVGLVTFRKKFNPIMVTTFLMSGLIWAIPMHHFVAFHDFQSLFFVGFSLLFFIIVSLYINPKFIRVIALAICLMFVLSVRTMNVKKDAVAKTVNSITHEFQAIYDHLPKDSIVFVDGDRHRLGIGYHALDFYLINTYSASPDSAEYVISPDPAYNQNKVTNNEHINLFINSSEP